MSQPFLICHLVRGEPAFDIAVEMDCPQCLGEGCIECDDKGHWWVVSTSGHRAFPWWQMPMDRLLYDQELCQSAYTPENLLDSVPPPPVGIPDHYSTRATPKQPSLAEALAAHMRKAAPPIKRRV